MQQQTIAKTFEVIEPIILQQGNYMLRHLKTKHDAQPFKLSDMLRNRYKLIASYFAHDVSFLEHGRNFSFKKGVMICGSVGTGKTLMMEIFSLIIRSSKGAPLFDLHDSHSIVRDFQINGFDTIEKFSSRYYYRDKTAKGLCIDDLGMEDQKAISYGNHANVMEQILYERYKRQRLDGMITHATTNCAPSDLGKLYGSRIADRMVEMFNIIELNGKSLRK